MDLCIHLCPRLKGSWLNTVNLIYNRQVRTSDICPLYVKSVICKIDLILIMLQLRCIKFCAPELFASPTQHRTNVHVFSHCIIQYRRLYTNMTVQYAVHVLLGWKYLVILACLAPDPFSFISFCFNMVVK